MTAEPGVGVGVTDLHIHVQPWEQLKPNVAEAMRQGKEDHWDRLGDQIQASMPTC